MIKCPEIHQKFNLQRCIKALLLDTDSESLAQDFLAGKYELTEDQLVHLLRHECDGYTLDQVRGVAQMYLTHWKEPGATRAHVQYAREPSVFNMLLHFVDEGMLHMENDTPVCHLDGILRWHDLTTQIGEDLPVCAYLAGHDLINPKTPPRKDFNWMPCLRTDDPTLNLLLELPLADIHSHLKGSSLNFDINWLCLMNHIGGRKDIFDKIEKEVQSSHVNEKRNGVHLYKKAVLAAALRLHFLKLIYFKRSDLCDKILKIMRGDRDTDIVTEAQILQTRIDDVRQRIGMQYKSLSNGDVALFDYAIINGVSVGRIDSLTLLSGERYLLYALLKNIYSGTEKGPKISVLFLIYLVIKNEIRHEITQLNDTVGFDNFSIYENRKMIFVKGFQQYEQAAIHLAIKGFFGDKDSRSRYHEVRITPENSGAEIVKAVKKLDRAIENDMLKPILLSWNYKYIFHFIKRKDDKISADCRHYQLRKEVKKQAQAIYNYRNSLTQLEGGAYVADRAVGIDAANSEIACRPEVFAQTFRFLRHHTIEHPNIHRPNDLGITFHVGEDFMDVVDGLRAVDEAILFLQLRKGDRIGHGLVLGVDVMEYYKTRNYTIAMSLQTMMDNMAWLYHYAKDLKGYSHLLGKIEERFEECYRKVYNDSVLPSMDVYYSSMLLRGDSPLCYKENGTVVNLGEDLAEWNSKALNSEKLCSRAREQREARKLYYQYHFNQDGKRNGMKYDELEVEDLDIIAAISEIQQRMVDKVQNLGLAIECNPTSNLKIGEFDRYDEHPILRFNNKGLKETPIKDISVSINTDDKGVFATSIEREYALIAHSLIRYFKQCGNYTTSTDVYDWLDRIRMNSLSQRFDKSPVVLDEPRRDTLAKYREHIVKEEKAANEPNKGWCKRYTRLLKNINKSN